MYFNIARSNKYNNCSNGSSVFDNLLYAAYKDSPKDFIEEQMIQNFKMSVKELLICKEMSVSNLITQHRGYSKKLKDFKKAIEKYCDDMGYSSITI